MFYFAGSRCVFLHPEEFKTTPCARLATTGYCSYGSNCIFIHPEDYLVPGALSEQSQGSLLESFSPFSSGQVTPQQPRSYSPDSVFGCVTPNPGRWSEASSATSSLFGFHEMPPASYRLSMDGSKFCSCPIVSFNLSVRDGVRGLRKSAQPNLYREWRTFPLLPAKSVRHWGN